MRELRLDIDDYDAFKEIFGGLDGNVRLIENAFGVVFDDVAGGLLVNIALQLFIIFSRSAGL